MTTDSATTASVSTTKATVNPISHRVSRSSLAAEASADPWKVTIFSVKPVTEALSWAVRRSDDSRDVTVSADKRKPGTPPLCRASFAVASRD